MSSRFAALLALLALILGPALVQAEAAANLGVRGLDLDQLSKLATQLGAEQPARREQAARALSNLRPESLPALGQRLTQLRRQRPDMEGLREALTLIRHGAGSRRADYQMDIAEGILPALQQRRDSTVLAVVEPLLLLRSLEAMNTLEAGRLMAEVLRMDEGLWRQELRLVRTRAGMDLLPVLIELRSHEASVVRRWAAYGVKALGMQEPATSTALPDAAQAAAVIAAYTRPLDFSAMPVLVRLVSHDKIQVRGAARAAVARFGKNAIWQLRELYQELSGEQADRSWSFETTASKLYAVVDQDRNHAAQAQLQRGLKAFVAGDMQTMQEQFDNLLVEAPDFPERAKLAPGYASLGDQRMAGEDLQGAVAAYRRALRLDPQSTQAPHWHSQLHFASGELSLEQGLLDLDSYERALAENPDNERAQAAFDQLSGTASRRVHAHRRLAAMGACVLLLAMAFMLRRPTDQTS